MNTSGTASTPLATLLEASREKSRIIKERDETHFRLTGERNKDYWTQQIKEILIRLTLLQQAARAITAQRP
ncbi:uncharacterized protein Bfra_005316 [Botrytis fragariae]|uniref:Uncharacterized protein n=1 Tax=Botrytis fragariae TaxID=1964551 RepID=A0A8H6AUF6_9HELO|nr:uncharacterized protein Bfra_005316 [Botrytis fragariae]KAF5873849.1 hypothetical protein Bfra_005316 [Botrytis fragariae]